MSACLSTAKLLHTIRGQYSQASLVIGSLCTQLTLTSASLSQIQDALFTDENTLRRITSPQVVNAFDTALIGCTVVLSCIDEEIKRLREPKDLTFKQKAAVVWNDETIKELTSQLQGQQSAITLLLQTTQMSVSHGLPRCR